MDHETVRIWVNAAERVERALAGRRPGGDEVSAGEEWRRALAVLGGVDAAVNAGFFVLGPAVGASGDPAGVSGLDVEGGLALVLGVEVVSVGGREPERGSDIAVQIGFGEPTGGVDAGDLVAVVRPPPVAPL